jgi:protein-S-isoprenylcysteine O-methyltransferase Ste14
VKCQAVNDHATAFNSIDKAQVAAILGILFVVQTYTGLQLPWATPDTIAVIIGLITPVLVWAIPNKKVADI